MYEQVLSSLIDPWDQRVVNGDLMETTKRDLPPNAACYAIRAV